MALNLDLNPGDIIVVPPDSGAQIRIVEKSGRRTRVAVESAKPVQVLRSSTSNAAPPGGLKRPVPAVPHKR